MLRNHVIFRGRQADFAEALALIWQSIHEANSLKTGTIQNFVDELSALQRLQVDGCPTKAPCVLGPSGALPFLVA